MVVDKLGCYHLQSSEVPMSRLHWNEMKDRITYSLGEYQYNLTLNNSCIAHTEQHDCEGWLYIQGDSLVSTNTSLCGGRAR